MKLAASYAIASLVGDDELAEDHVIPDAFDKRVAPAVAAAVAKAAMEAASPASPVTQKKSARKRQTLSTNSTPCST